MVNLKPILDKPVIDLLISVISGKGDKLINAQPFFF